MSWVLASSWGFASAMLPSLLETMSAAAQQTALSFLFCVPRTFSNKSLKCPRQSRKYSFPVLWIPYRSRLPPLSDGRALQTLPNQWMQWHSKSQILCMERRCHDTARLYSCRMKQLGVTGDQALPVIIRHWNGCVNGTPINVHVHQNCAC